MEKTDSRSYYESLPKKRMAAGVLLFNGKNELLIVKPNYRPDWLLPGGIVEENESPKAAAIRELKEETGLDIGPDRFGLAAVDYKHLEDTDSEMVHFIFDGGALAKGAVNKIVLQKKELDDYKFVSTEEALSLLNVNLSKRVARVLVNLEDARPLYLENGEVA